MTDPEDWATISTNGVPARPAPSGLSATEAASPARRSPQVREAQRTGSRRPDLLDHQPSDR